MLYTCDITQELDWQHSANWQTPDTPFMTFAFWQALSDTGAIGDASGWIPFYIIIKADQTPAAVIPVFIKAHHQGEYVFDHAWAEAYAQYGIDYYPRLVTSVPYTPITGQRFWVAQGATLNTDIVQAAMQGIKAIASQIKASSWHGLFVNQALADMAMQAQASLLKREGCQFLWQNKNISNDGKSYTNFEEFLATLTAKKRKNIRAERKKVAKQNLTCQIKTGGEISAHDWEVFYQCYAMTYVIRGRHPYLSKDFFVQLATTMPEHLMLAQAVDKAGAIFASSLFLYDKPDASNATLYGRYWGALATYDSLHFELCYYQGIEFAIKQGLQYFDPGTQGEHKLIRGFVPTKTHSLHRIYDERFMPAIADFCQQDREYMYTYRQQAHEALPFNAGNMPKFKG